MVWSMNPSGHAVSLVNELARPHPSSVGSFTEPLVRLPVWHSAPTTPGRTATSRARWRSSGNAGAC
ncbi:protein of unknown function [Streptantibioticus cattleyicolor NRRL 8057 = DSM 46488]|nr:protein of unknown function [Streptantibioticus cattleyicolor NRRL 8057 = DSM 46488]